jgi:hypothetical protein
MVYAILYIHTDEPVYSEVLGLFDNKSDAVAELLERANYRNTNGMLTQYMKPCDEYESFDALVNLVSTKMELIDTDIYRITELPVI